MCPSFYLVFSLCQVGPPYHLLPPRLDKHAGNFIMECEQMELEFAKISFVHCFRDANEVADSLAKISLTIRSSGFLENVL